MKYEISLAKTPEEIRSTFPIMRQLRQEITSEKYLLTIQSMQKQENFHLAFLKNKESVLCVSGYKICRSLGWGKYLYVDDLVTDDASRSLGYGKAMFDWLVEQAKNEKCDQIRLESATYRHESHRFYLREHMDITCFHFVRTLTVHIPDDQKPGNIKK